MRMPVIDFLKIGRREQIKLLSANSNFQIDKSVSIEMERLTSSAKWKLLVPLLKIFVIRM
jgi:hypothetical protein